MSEYIRKTIEELEHKLQDQLDESAETKKTINLLCRQLGEPPRFEDVLPESIKGTTNIKADQFFNKALATAVRDYLKIRGTAATVDEIYIALTKGGFGFVGKNEGIKKRGLQISLSKSRRLFAYIKASDTFGLWEFYGGRPKVKEEGEEEEETEMDNNENEPVEENTKE